MVNGATTKLVVYNLQAWTDIVANEGYAYKTTMELYYTLYMMMSLPEAVVPGAGPAP